MTKTATHIRIGPLSLFALIAMLFLSTLAVLSFTTADASLNLSKLQSEGMSQQYQAESAAQRFVALLCNDNGAASSTDALAKEAAQSVSSDLEATASRDNESVNAQFACPSGRTLDVELTLGANNSVTIISWNMTAIVNEAEADTLWSGM